MSASVTGESWPLVQVLSGRSNSWASVPAARTATSRRSAKRCRSSALSDAGNGQALDAQGRCVGAIAEFEIIGRRERVENFTQVAGDRHLAHRIGERAILDPESRGAAAVVSGHQIDPHTDEVGHVEALGDIGDQLVRRSIAGLEMEVRGAGRWRRGYAALGMAGGGKIKLARGCRIEEPGGQHTLVHDRTPLAGHAFVIEWVRAQPAPPQRIINNGNVRREHLLAELVLQKARVT